LRRAAGYILRRGRRRQLPRHWASLRQPRPHIWHWCSWSRASKIRRI